MNPCGLWMLSPEIWFICSGKSKESLSSRKIPDYHRALILTHNACRVTLGFYRWVHFLNSIHNEQMDVETSHVWLLIFRPPTSQLRPFTSQPQLVSKQRLQIGTPMSLVPIIDLNKDGCCSTYCSRCENRWKQKANEVWDRVSLLTSFCGLT